MRPDRARVWRWIVLAGVLASCRSDPAESPHTRLPIETPKNKLGVHLLLDDGLGAWPVEVWPEHLDYARQAVGEWGFALQLVRLDDLDPAKWQVFMDLCAERHLTPVLRLATTVNRRKGWWRAPPPDRYGQGYETVARRYARFVAALEWPTDAHYVTVGNEPNHGNEWGGRPDPAAYGRFFIDVADALHAADPQVRVLNAGLDPYAPHTGGLPFVDGMYYVDEETFLDEMVAAEPSALARVDVWASHAYPMGAFRGGPWEQAYGRDMLNDAHNPAHREPPEGVANRGVNGYEWELWKLSTYGIDPLPVMITETGWRHAESADPASLDALPDLPDGETVAAYVDMALRGNGGRYPEYPDDGWTPWLDDPRVVAVMPFALDGDPAEWGHTNWLVLGESGEVVGMYPVFDLLAGLEKSG